MYGGAKVLANINSRYLCYIVNIDGQRQQIPWASNSNSNIAYYGNGYVFVSNPERYFLSIQLPCVDDARSLVDLTIVIIIMCVIKSIISTS